MATSTLEESWQSLDPESLVAAPCLIDQTLCQPNDEKAQLAKDVNYAKAILDAWKHDEQDVNSWLAVWKPAAYQDAQGTDLYGYFIRRDAVSNDNDQTIPAILFFHTAVGPHDLFLLYKAVSLVNSVEQDCLVFIADLFGDESGWGWDADRTRYNAVRKQVLAVNEEATPHCHRPVLQQRIQAAMDCILAATNINVDRFAALGWCFGGHPILEISRMSAAVQSQFHALVTFHGVFDGLDAPLPTQVNEKDTTPTPDILICHGVDDPFVPEETIEKALATFQAMRFRTQLLQLRAKHGFTNPAQEFNENPAFSFDADAAAKAWRQALNLLRQKLW